MESLEIKKFRDFLLSVVDKNTTDTPALFLSSGTDSNLLLFSLLTLGKKVTAYSIHVDGIYSTDFIHAQKNAEIFKIPFKEIIIPKELNIDVLINLILTHKQWKKVFIEISYVYHWAIRQIKQNSLIAGIGGDDHFGLSREAHLKYKDDLIGFDKYRIKEYKNRLVQYSMISKQCEEIGIKYYSPYLEKFMMDYFLGKSWLELNKPKEKNLWHELFPDMMRQIKWVKHTNLQCGDSGIRDIFTPILSTSYNKNKRTRVIDVYRDIKEGKV